jgi:hypothetical protein
MGEIDKGESYDFDKDFKDLPVENRMNLIKTAKSLLEVLKVSKENAPLALTSAPSTGFKEQELA